MSVKVPNYHCRDDCVKVQGEEGLEAGGVSNIMVKVHKLPVVFIKNDVEDLKARVRRDIEMQD